MASELEVPTALQSGYLSKVGDEVKTTEDLLYVKMKSAKTEYCGYNKLYLIERLTETEEELVVCRVCSGIMREASLCNGDTTCLVCSKTPTQPTPVRMVQNYVSKLKIKCPLLTYCSWMGTISEAEKHLEICTWILVACPECKQIMRKREIFHHSYSSCPMREIKCEFCKVLHRFKEKEKHLEVCKEYPVSCPNKCEEIILRRELTLHKSLCQLELITCPYAEYGCETRTILRKDLTAHKRESIIEHTDMSLSRLKKAEEEISRLEIKIEEQVRVIKTMKPLDGIEWEIVNLALLPNFQFKEGPDFLINKYKFNLSVCNNNKKWYFYIERIRREFDRNLTVAARVTQFRAIVIDKEDPKESYYEDGPMSYSLKYGTEKICFFEILCSIFDTWLTPHGSLFVRFYFDIN